MRRDTGGRLLRRESRNRRVHPSTLVIRLLIQGEPGLHKSSYSIPVNRYVVPLEALRVALARELGRGEVLVIPKPIVNHAQCTCRPFVLTPS